MGLRDDAEETRHIGLWDTYYERRQHVALEEAFWRITTAHAKLRFQFNAMLLEIDQMMCDYDGAVRVDLALMREKLLTALDADYEQCRD